MAGRRHVAGQAVGVVGVVEVDTLPIGSDMTGRTLPRIMVWHVVAGQAIVVAIVVKMDIWPGVGAVAARALAGVVGGGRLMA